MKLEDIKGKFDVFEKVKLNLEDSVEYKRKIIEENRNKLALIEIKDIPNKYIFGIIEPKNTIFFGLNVIENKEKYICPEIIKYENLSKIIICES